MKLTKKLTIAPKDLTIGSPAGKLLLYALPMLASMFFQQAYNLADSWIAGNYIGPTALGAVGTCYPVTVLFIAFASGLSMGTSIYCSQRFGAKKYRDVQSGITTSLLSFLPFSIVLCLLGLALCPFMLRWLSVPAEAAAETSQYLYIYIMGLLPLFLYNISNGILNGLGDSRTPLMLLILSSLCNIFLDLMFVIWIPMGVAGLAIATLASQTIAAVATAFMMRRLYTRLITDAALSSERTPYFSRDALYEMLRLGVPSVIQHAFMSTGQLFMQNVINSYGVVVMAGYSVAFRVNGLVINSLMAFSNALSGFIAQNKGAGYQDRIRKGVQVALKISYIFSGAIVVLLFFAGEPILAFFVEESTLKADVIAAGIGFFRVVSPFYLLVCLKIVYDGALRGIGAMTPFMLATVSDVVIRILFGGVFSRLFGLNGVWCIWPFAWLVGTVMSVSFYQFKSRTMQNPSE